MNFSRAPDAGSRLTLPGKARSGIGLGSNALLALARLKKLELTSAVPGSPDMPARKNAGLRRPLVWQLAQLTAARSACPPSRFGAVNRARPMVTAEGDTPGSRQVAGCSRRTAVSRPGAVQVSAVSLACWPAGAAASDSASAQAAIRRRIGPHPRSAHAVHRPACNRSRTAAQALRDEPKLLADHRAQA